MMFRPKCKKKVVFITGASSGIGAQLAREFGSRGGKVVLAARREDRLMDLERELTAKGIPALALKCDVTQPLSIRKAVQAVQEQWGQIDIAVANAGFAVSGEFADLSVEDYRRQFETNVFGVLNTAYETFEDLKKTKGILAIMGSIAGHVSLPGATAYSMSKFAVKGLANGLLSEFQKSGVAVSLICPGFVKSEIYQVDNQGVHHDQPAHAVPTWLMVPTAVAAREMVDAILRRKPEAVITGHAKMLAAFHRAAPQLADYVLRMELRRLTHQQPELK